MTVTLREILAVGAGSFCGGAARMLTSRLLQPHNLAFPLGTLAVNTAGCFLLGLISCLLGRGFDLSPSWRLFLTVGFCGGFTTFSTFVSETGHLAAEGLTLSALGYASLSLILGFAALWAGNSVGRLIL